MSTKDELFEELADTLGDADFSYNEFDSSDEAVTYIRRGTSVETVAEHVLAAGYRKIFDGDCGLSSVKDPTDREASEAWMRWANIAMNDEIGAIGAMKQMLSEFGYRKPRTITTAEELDALPEGTTIVDQAERLTLEETSIQFLEWVDRHGNACHVELPATVLHDPEARS